MSIYCSFGCIDDESDRPRSRKRPIRYQGSHVLPGEKDEHSGSVDLAYIPPHISRGRRKGSEDGAFWPWLRMGIAEKNMSAGETVILNRKQVEELRDSLNWWLEQSKRGQEFRDNQLYCSRSCKNEELNRGESNNA